MEARTQWTGRWGGITLPPPSNHRHSHHLSLPSSIPSGNRATFVCIEPDPTAHHMCQQLSWQPLARPCLSTPSPRAFTHATSRLGGPRQSTQDAQAVSAAVSRRGRCHSAAAVPALTFCAAALALPSAAHACTVYRRAESKQSTMIKCYDAASRYVGEQVQHVSRSLRSD